jgi:hypothetical protein
MSKAKKAFETGFGSAFAAMQPGNADKMGLP